MSGEDMGSGDLSQAADQAERQKSKRRPRPSFWTHLRNLTEPSVDEVKVLDEISKASRIS